MTRAISHSHDANASGGTLRNKNVPIRRNTDETWIIQTARKPLHNEAGRHPKGRAVRLGHDGWTIRRRVGGERRWQISGRYLPSYTGSIGAKTAECRTTRENGRDFCA